MDSVTKSHMDVLRNTYEQYGRLSASYLQRKLRISYERAIKLIKQFNEDRVK